MRSYVHKIQLTNGWNTLEFSCPGRRAPLSITSQDIESYSLNEEDNQWTFRFKNRCAELPLKGAYYFVGRCRSPCLEEGQRFLIRQSSDTSWLERSQHSISWSLWNLLKRKEPTEINFRRPDGGISFEKSRSDSITWALARCMIEASSQHVVSLSTFDPDEYWSIPVLPFELPPFIPTPERIFSCRICLIFPAVPDPRSHVWTRRAFEKSSSPRSVISSSLDSTFTASMDLEDRYFP